MTETLDGQISRRHQGIRINGFEADAALERAERERDIRGAHFLRLTKTYLSNAEYSLGLLRGDTDR